MHAFLEALYLSRTHPILSADGLKESILERQASLNYTTGSDVMFPLFSSVDTPRS